MSKRLVFAVLLALFFALPAAAADKLDKYDSAYVSTLNMTDEEIAETYGVDSTKLNQGPTLQELNEENPSYVKREYNHRQQVIVGSGRRRHGAHEQLQPETLIRCASAPNFFVLYSVYNIEIKMQWFTIKIFDFDVKSEFLYNKNFGFWKNLAYIIGIKLHLIWSNFFWKNEKQKELDYE